MKVTIELSRRGVDYFKRAAKARRVPYQRMIRALVDACAEKQKGVEEALLSNATILFWELYSSYLSSIAKR